MKNTLAFVSILFVCVLCALGLYMTGLIPGKPVCDPETVCALSEPSGPSEEAPDPETESPSEALPDASCQKPVKVTEDVPGSLSHEGYTLEKVVVLSRHNIRSPLSTGDSLLAKVTPHEWFEWTSASSELSLRGGALETTMGHFFRKWLEEESLFPENYHPEDDAVRIYANSKQRTIATAQYFLAGLLPTANLDVEYHMEFDKMDPVFTPQITYVSDSYRADAEAQVMEMFSGTITSLSDNYELLSDVIDLQESEAWKDGTVSAFSTEDTDYIIEIDAEPKVTGSLKTATSISDALVLQYYEESDPIAAAFGNDLSDEQWESICEIKEVYGEVIFSAPLISANTANPLLREIAAEMDAEERVFTFLCGHDSNIVSVLSALETEEYSLPNTIEKKAPIGVKLVFSKFVNAEGESFWAVDLVYQTTNQLRDLTLLDLQNHPAIVPVILKDLERNADGLYPEQALKDRFERSIAAYDALAEKYPQEN
ncbi:MAG: histidine-type phosphatase [Flexilinea sp.]|nr:histidine-type phosphatase [Flexilinea sp.]